MLKLKVNEIEVEVEEGLTVLQAVKKLELKSLDFVIMKSCQ
jgi:NADH dehydrogenase/NADH:ubiquinone oxidoreductase subunit G